ncbi:MAG TPA: alpha/beta hydrolase [Gammaproteobacteria bacterium]|nr:alpha/beta hydrolase [Gammaproteobacteria bacterium]
MAINQAVKPGTDLKNTAISLLLICCLVSISVLAAGNDDWRQPPGQLYDIGGYRLHMLCEGQGKPAVIMDAGIGGFSLEWIPVQRLLRTETYRVCVYDRAGYGWSDPGPSPRTTDQIVEELHTLLNTAGVNPPYILVGHSFGGYNMQYFAKAYPQEVGGLVLVDSSHPEQVDRLPEIPSTRERSSTGQMITLFAGQSTFKYYPQDVRNSLLRLVSLRKTFITQRRESVNMAISGEQVVRAGHLPDIPLLVITRGIRVWPEDPYGDMLETTWMKMQKELASMTPHGRQIIAAKSNHLIHLLQPDLVANAIRSIVDEYESSLTTVVVDTSSCQPVTLC